jgi:hypothetical protein
MNYADFAFATLLMLMGTPDGVEPGQDVIEWRLGRNNKDKDGPGKQGVVSVDYLSRFRIAGSGLRPYVTVGSSTDGLRYLGVGAYKRLAWGPFELMPSAGPALYHSNRGKGTSERLQFRTGIELNYPLQGDAGIGVGFYHLSNARLSKDTAAVDVTYVSWRLRF